MTKITPASKMTVTRKGKVSLKNKTKTIFIKPSGLIYYTN